MNSGGMGQIYKIEDKDLGNRVCILKELIISKFLPQDRQVVIASFQREAALLARLNHPNLPRATDYFMENGNFYLVVDYVQGDNLEEIRMTRRCSEEEVIRWSLSILDILEYLHNQQPPIIYRDLKPANIMLDINGNIKLIDFGIAREFDPAFTNKQTNIGTHGYAPPEQYQGKAEPRSDLYSLGVVMHYLLSGQDPQPFNLQPIETIIKNTSSQLATVISTATDLRINYRYPNTIAMRQALSSSIGNISSNTSIWQDYDNTVLKNLEFLLARESYDVFKGYISKSLNYFKNGFFENSLIELKKLNYTSLQSSESIRISEERKRMGYYTSNVPRFNQVSRHRSKQQHFSYLHTITLILARQERWLDLELSLNSLILHYPEFNGSYVMLANYKAYFELEQAERDNEKRLELEVKKQKKKEAWEDRKKQFLSFFTRILKK